LEWLEIAGVTPDLIRGRNDGEGAMTGGNDGRSWDGGSRAPALRWPVGRDAHIAPRYEGGTVKTVPYSTVGANCVSLLDALRLLSLRA